MPRFKLTGYYGTFVISKFVEAIGEDDAHAATGIMAALEDDGWHFESTPDGEEWEIEPCPATT